MNAAELIKKLDKVTEAKLDAAHDHHVTQFEAILVAEGMDAFVSWAKAFPKRELRFASGMGVCTFACPSMDRSCFIRGIDDYCDYDAEDIMVDYSDRVAAMLKPLIEFHRLFWSSDHYQYPSFADIIYNPVTRTVECGQIIIQLNQQ